MPLDNRVFKLAEDRLTNHKRPDNGRKDPNRSDHPVHVNRRPGTGVRACADRVSCGRIAKGPKRRKNAADYYYYYYCATRARNR